MELAQISIRADDLVEILPKGRLIQDGQNSKLRNVAQLLRYKSTLLKKISIIGRVPPSMNQKIPEFLQLILLGFRFRVPLRFLEKIKVTLIAFLVSLPLLPPSIRTGNNILGCIRKGVKRAFLQAGTVTHKYPIFLRDFFSLIKGLRKRSHGANSPPGPIILRCPRNLAHPPLDLADPAKVRTKIEARFRVNVRQFSRPSGNLADDTNVVVGELGQWKVRVRKSLL